MQPIKSVLPFCSALPIQYTHDLDSVWKKNESLQKWKGFSIISGCIPVLRMTNAESALLALMAS